MGVYLEREMEREILSANYITFVNPALHPDRVLNEHDFLYMLDGSWEVGEEDRVFSIHSDDLLILPAGRHHYGAGLCSPNNRHMYIHVNGSAAELALNRGFPEGEKGTAPSTAKACRSVIHCQNRPRIRELFQEIIAEHWGDSPLKKEKLSLLFRVLLCELAEQQERERDAEASRDLTSQVSRLIQTTPQTFFTGKELAERFYVCERTLTNQFKKVYGKTVYAYQMDVKLEMVRQFLLAQPDVKLHETALNFGFCDEFHLSRTFRKKYGVAPGRYRENMGFSGRP